MTYWYFIPLILVVLVGYFYLSGLLPLIDTHLKRLMEEVNMVEETEVPESEENAEESEPESED